MTTRKQAAAKTERGGQALVMVTLALIAMCGMMGLAVDLGWSFFVQKQAQVAADGAALAAVQEAYQRFGGNFGKPPCGNGLTQAHCAVVPVACQSIANVSNLKNGCLYAERNGFVSGTNRQVVTMEANMDPAVLTSLGVTDMSYFVRARVAQTIPQLFSSIMGNTQGTISAVATAAIAAVIAPGSFYGMNQEGDCLTNSSGNFFNCGVDIDLQGANSGGCPTSGGVSAKICAPGGMYLASQCNGTAKAGCGNSAGNNMASGSNFAGEIQGGGNVWAGSTIMIRGGGGVNPTNQFLPGTASGTVPDPMLNKPQPPILAPNNPLRTCGVLNGNLPNGATVGAFQYYAYTVVGGVPTPNGNPINVSGTTTFSNNQNCSFSGSLPSATGAGQSNANFPVTIFYGGLNITGTANFGAGEYVLAGTKALPNNASSPVLNVDKGTVTGATAAQGGTVFILTDGSYDGALATQASAAALGSMPASLVQGYTMMSKSDVSLSGAGASAPAALRTVHQNMLFWQDRRNSNINLNPATGAPLTTPVQLPPASYHRTNRSPVFITDHGNGNVNMRGVFYQPRGAWIELQSGGANSGGPLQIVTGAVDCPTGCGNNGIILQSPSAPIIKYVTALVQ